MGLTPAEQLAAAIAAVITVEATLLALAWRVSAWRTSIDHRLSHLERQVGRLERHAGIGTPARHKHRGSP